MSLAELTVPADPSFVGLVRLVVGQCARQAGVAQDRVEDVKLAVDEAVANAVRARHTARTQRPVTLAFGPTARGFEVVIHGIDAPSVPVGDAPAGGVELVDPTLSFTLIEGLGDVVDYRRDDASTDLWLLIASD
jgi:anti-sigma regulatory factor (Ser/Thr protein kinase)